MNIWFFVILVIALALVIGPVSMLRPSPAQRRKEQLRLHAAKLGLRFSMRQLPLLKTDLEASAPIPVYYLPPQAKPLVATEWILMRTRYVHEGNFYLEWDWQSDARPSDAVCALLKLYLPQLPASVPAISQGNLGTCVFWQEKEGEETLDQLVEMLTQLHQASSVGQN